MTSASADPRLILHESGCSLVVVDNRDETHTFRSRGVADLFNILSTNPALLHEARVADKVVGKGAAALMVIGGVSSLQADVISRPALAFLKGASVQVDYLTLVDGITNRSGTGPCPVETLCMPLSDPRDCYDAIAGFIESINSQPKQ